MYVAFRYGNPIYTGNVYKIKDLNKKHAVHGEHHASGCFIVV